MQTLPADPPLLSDCLVTGKCVVEVYEVEQLQPIRGWVPIDSSISTKESAAVDKSKKLQSTAEQKAHRTLAHSFVPWNAFDSNEVLGLQIAGSLDEIISLVEQQIGFQRPGCTAMWEPWTAALKSTPAAYPKRDRRSASTTPGASNSSTPDKGFLEPVGRHADPAVLAEAAWEYAFNSKHDFAPLPEGVSPPTATSASEGLVGSQHRVFIRRRKLRCSASIAWESPYVVPEGVRGLSIWCSSVKIHKAPDSQTNSPRVHVPALSLGSRKGSVGPASVSEAPLSGRHTRSRAASSIASTSRPGLIPVDHWMKDTDAQLCINCQKKFTVVTRRHHCRLCGRVFCAQCCEKSNRFGGVRVCLPCLREDELCERLMQEEQFEEEERVREMERDLLADGPMEVEEEFTQDDVAGENLVRVPTIASPLGRRTMTTLLLQLEADCREVIASEEVDEFVFLTSLGTKELSVLQEICELHTLPSLVQLSDSLRVVNFENSVRLANSGDPMSPAAKRKEGSPTRVIVPPSTTTTKPLTPASATPSTAPPKRTLTGLLHVMIPRVTGIRVADGTMVRCDIRIGTSPTSSPFRGDWCKLNEAPLVGYVMLHNEADVVNMSVNTRGGNALTDLVLEVTTTVAQVEFTVASLLTPAQLQEAHAARKPTQFKGSYVCPEVLSSGYKKPIKGAEATIQWTFDVRPIMGNMDFCDICGRIATKCTCYDEQIDDTLPKEAPHDETSHIVEPVFLGSTERSPSVESSTEHSLTAHGAKPTRSEIVSSERSQAIEAWDKLVTCAAERMVLEKRFTITNIEQEQREEYGKLRNTYFRATNSLFYRIARKKKFPEIEKALRAIGDEAAKRVACVYLARWHQHGIIFGPEIRLKRARCRLEERIGLHNAAANTLDEKTIRHGATNSMSQGPQSTTLPPHAKSPTSAKAHPKRKPTSEKCCSLM